MALFKHISERLIKEKKALTKQFETSNKIIKYFYLDNLLPEKIALEVHSQFPTLDKLKHNKTIREDKYIGVNLEKYHPLVSELLMAFQKPEVVNAVKDITKISNLEPDGTFYAAGVSAMTTGNYLNPHLDNSHNADRSKYRALNLLYYLTPDWWLEDGGNLEVWPNGVKKDQQIEIHSKFNRLVVMSTHNKSWHSVCPVKVPDAIRTCFSNYYFTKQSPIGVDYFNVTTFRGRPENKLDNLILTADGILRNLVRKIKKRNVAKITHIHKG